MPSAVKGDVRSAWLDDELHELCQPLTALECRLCLSQMTGWPDAQTECMELRRVVEDGLRQVQRMMLQVRRMQGVVHAAEMTEGAR